MKSYLNKIVWDNNMKVLRELPDKLVDLAIYDPPFGVGWDGQKAASGKSIRQTRKAHRQKCWDYKIPSAECFAEIERVSKNQIIFGGNHFVEHLKPSRGWIIYDKGQRGLTMGDAEVIYSTFNRPIRVLKYNRANLGKTIHPTEKPLKLIKMLIHMYAEEGDILLDPFSGSGVLAVAAYEMNHPFIAIERDPDYHKASVKRLEDVQRQGRLEL